MPTKIIIKGKDKEYEELSMLSLCHPEFLLPIGRFISGSMKEKSDDGKNVIC